MTSHDAVALARRALGTRRIGHTGTLDPFATGLLVLLAGRATRLARWASGEPKVYEATVRFGAATDTDDATGTVTASAPVPGLDAIEAALPRLTGTIAQRPPAYSAKQVAGVRAYDAARAGEPLELAPAQVEVHRWEILGWAPPDLRVRITCGGGTYIRALARDLGALTGSAAHLVALRRLRSGAFDVSDAVPAGALDAESAVRPLRDAVPALLPVHLDAGAAARVRHGNPVAAPGAEPGPAALLDDSGELLAIAEREGERWCPRTVLVEG
ncbi:MAG TPA: tRNA pseudouridine(55) synthase TruB [Gemmatimonadaceae bacterium]